MSVNMGASMGIEKRKNKSRVISVKEIYKGTQVQCMTSGDYKVTFSIPDIGAFFDNDIIRIDINSISSKVGNGFDREVDGVVKTLEILTEDVAYLKHVAITMAKAFRG